MNRTGVFALVLGTFLAGACGTAERFDVVPGQVFKDCAECPEMVVVPAGSYEMGSTEMEWDQPVHTVTIGKPLAVGRYEVTFEEWDACLRDGGCKDYSPNHSHWGRGRLPVSDVTWLESKSYVEWLAGKTAKSYRLLTEAEWEYVARAGTRTRYWWGDELGAGHANCRGCGPGLGEKVEPVGSFQPNAFGLFDTAGNVAEWVEDCLPTSGSERIYMKFNKPPTDGSAVTSCDTLHRRYVRGGAWAPTALNDGTNIRSASRSLWHRSAGSRHIGFRVARDLD